ncbi:MAG: helix-turn-helix transcriptional regulator [Candidatus Melainabacteria bacterium]|jgi:transcriptional regulator with XRE-family HTH domain|nr:helix-turn-helix transcriptional regulator [Candidatus Melainabacteria bacterium]
MITKQQDAFFESLGIKTEVTHIGDTLRVFREAEGITQSSLAHQLGISRQRLCDFEKARRYPSIPMAIKWATILGHCPSIVIESLVKEQLERANVAIKTLKLTLDLS